jgi:septin family protein
MAMDIMENLSSFAQLKQILSQPDIKTVMVLMGNKSAGKTTFIHYLMETQLTQGINEDNGLDILSLGDRQHDFKEVTVIEDLLVVVEVPKERIVFVEVIGFENEEEEEHNKKWSFTMDYLLYVLSTMKPEVKISFILIFTFSEFK